VDLDGLSALQLADPDGASQRLGDYWADQPVVLVFLRHFGCLLCREHAVQLRGRYDEVKARGAEVVAVGTGNHRYAARFVSDEDVPFPVLVDDDAEAAAAASVRSTTPWGLFNPRSFPGARQAHRAGHRVHKSGRRVTQLGATFVVGPGDQVLYEHVDAHTADHAPLDEVFAALP
jgi:peroxiredoxin